MKTVINFLKWGIRECYYKVNEIDGNPFAMGDLINVNGIYENIVLIKIFR